MLVTRFHPARCPSTQREQFYYLYSFLPSLKSVKIKLKRIISTKFPFSLSQFELKKKLLRTCSVKDRKLAFILEPFILIQDLIFFTE